MKSLADIIDKCPGGVNEILSENIKGSFKAHGLVRTAKKGEELINYEAKNSEVIVFINDEFNNFFYHKLVRATFTEIKAPGKKKLYNANASINLICYSGNIDFHDHIINKLSQFSNITINESDFDAYRIIQAETGKSDFDFSKHVFVVNYQLRYQTDNCNEACQ